MVISPSLRIAQTRPAWLGWALVGAYALLTAVVVSGHEPWRDELHAWLLVRYSDSLRALYINKAYEGHPMLWFLMLYVVNGFTTDFAVVQLLHWGIGVLMMALLVRYAPFSLTEKALIGFGYFFAYEYTVIARNYAVGLLMLTVVCALFPHRNTAKGYWLLCLALVVLVQTSVFVAFIGCAIYAVFLLEIAVYSRDRLMAHLLRYGLGSALVGLGLLACYLSIRPPQDNMLTAHFTPTYDDVLWCLGSIWNAFVPIPNLTDHFWGTNLIDSVGSRPWLSILKTGLTIGLLWFVIKPLFRSQLAFGGWLLTCVVLLTLFSTQYSGTVRHHGHFLLAFVFFQWIQPYLADVGTPVSHKVVRQQARAQGLWRLLLLVQVACMLFAAARDFRRPFSQSKQAADFIRTGGYDTWTIAGSPDPSAEAIAAWLPGYRMFYPGNGQQNGFIIWDNKHQNRTLPQLVAVVQAHKKGPALLALAYQPPASLTNSLHLKLVRAFTASIVLDEQYWLYELR